MITKMKMKFKMLQPRPKRNSTRRRFFSVNFPICPYTIGKTQAYSTSIGRRETLTLLLEVGFLQLAALYLLISFSGISLLARWCTIREMELLFGTLSWSDRTLRVLLKASKIKVHSGNSSKTIWVSMPFLILSCLMKMAKLVERCWIISIRLYWPRMQKENSTLDRLGLSKKESKLSHVKEVPKLRDTRINYRIAMIPIILPKRKKQKWLMMMNGALGKR